jgi:hypothetical protein
MPILSRPLLRQMVRYYDVINSYFVDVLLELLRNQQQQLQQLQAVVTAAAVQRQSPLERTKALVETMRNHVRVYPQGGDIVIGWVTTLENIIVDIER